MNIANENVRILGEFFDYRLCDGTLLHQSDWNGEAYITKNDDGVEVSYRPIYKYERDNIDINQIEENSDEWNDAVEIVGFKD